MPDLSVLSSIAYSDAGLLLAKFKTLDFKSSSHEFMHKTENVSSRYLKSGLLYISIADSIAAIDFSNINRDLDFMISLRGS